MSDIYFAKVKEDAIIPSKRLEDGGYDLYPCFDEDFIIIEPFASYLVPTGIISAFHHSKVALLRERGSTGIKNIKINAGVIDSGYRDQWFICVYNGNDKRLIIVKDIIYQEDYKSTDRMLQYLLSNSEQRILYPYNKAIAQAIFVRIDEEESILETDVDFILSVISNRGIGKLGSSQK
jgi:dUTP pyrophosphatase